MSLENIDESMRKMALRLALKDEEKRKTNPNETHERSLIIIGSKSVGKTTMVYRFLEKDETPKPTIAMDYSFGRKAGKSLVKDVVHVWEIGHLTSSLVSAAMLGSALTHSPHHVTLMIMLDLSTPQSLWYTLDESLTVARSAMKMSYDSRIVEEMKNARVRERKKETETEVDPFPMRLCIIGGKYDKFKEFDMERKQLVGRTLRAVAHCLGASLQYHSSRDTVLIRRTKDLLTQYGFGTQPNKGVCLDYEKPLVVPTGTDSFSSINFKLPHGRPAAIIDTIKQSYVGSIPQAIKTEELNLEDPANDPNFQEPIIDRLRSQREEEISILLQDMLEGHTPKIAIPEPL